MICRTLVGHRVQCRSGTCTVRYALALHSYLYNAYTLYGAMPPPANTKQQAPRGNRTSYPAHKIRNHVRATTEKITPKTAPTITASRTGAVDGRAAPAARAAPALRGFELEAPVSTKVVLAVQILHARHRRGGEARPEGAIGASARDRHAQEEGDTRLVSTLRAGGCVFE